MHEATFIPEQAGPTFRKLLYKQAYVSFENRQSTIVRTTDISYFDLYVASPVHAKKKTKCWLNLSIPENPEENQTFEVQAMVISSIYSKSADGFKIGLAFISPSPLLLRCIHQL